MRLCWLSLASAASISDLGTRTIWRSAAFILSRFWGLRWPLPLLSLAVLIFLAPIFEERLIMVFKPSNDTEIKFIKELQLLPDRIVGIVAPAMLEACLRKAIKVRLRDTNKVFNKLFSINGSLGTFGSLINMGAALAIFGSDAYSDLQQINQIRNLFAHETEAEDFNFQSINDKVNFLRLPNIYPAISSQEYADLFAAITDRLKPQGTIITLDEFWRLKVASASLSGDGKPTTPRARFLRTIAILTTFLDAMTVAKLVPILSEPRF